MRSITLNFQELNSRLLDTVNLFEPGPVKSTPFSTASQFIRKLQENIERAAGHFNREYQKGYITPLLSNLEPIIARLLRADQQTGGEDAQSYAILTILINAVLQPAQRGMAQYIRASQRVVNQLYNAFLEKRAVVRNDIVQKVPPLVGFVGPLPTISGIQISDRVPMPCMLEVEQLQDREVLGSLARDFTVGVVGLPAGYRNDPLLWGVLGHEVGGHYVLTADQRDRILHELQNKLYEELCQMYKRGPLSKVPALWHFWTEETAAEVCGVLNLGPSYGIGAIAFYTALLYKGNWGKKNVLSGAFENGNRHPCPALIPYVIYGAVEALKELSPSRRGRYMEQLDEISRCYTGQARAITIKAGALVPDPDKKGKAIALPRALPLKAMQESARHVGHYMATVALKALKGTNLQSLATWRDEDENAAIAVAAALASRPGTSLVQMNGKKGKDVQLLTGGILSAIRSPARYEDINMALQQTLCRT